MSNIQIPQSMLPEDGRFGSGPTKIREAQMQALNDAFPSVIGTSHRQSPVKLIVASLREGLPQFFSLPDGYEIALGNGGASAFWEIACANLISRKAACGVYGSFTKKFAKSIETAPFLEKPAIFECEPGDYRLPEFTEYADSYCWAHNETSTGVAAPVQRVEGSERQNALTIIDATSGAGALPIDISQTDAYYFSPQKAFGAEGGLWVSVLSPAAIERAYHIEESASLPGAARWIPPFLSLTSALENSRKNQTLNTPALATLILMDNQVKYLNEQGGLQWATERCKRSASILYRWAEQSEYASPFVTNPEARSNAVVTVDLDESVSDNAVLAALRDNGIVDVNSYRKLGRNQLRIGVFPSVEPSDVRALTECIDYVVEHL
ncbi:phosphoserine transaminase [Bifidobacterium gallicum]|uniref:phosphoserine transaminase n=1 Tax=Bifidobacterium gallicum DSM 20093 = LMG 11596 TaxID=561180 RepID=D1NV48_9BIFI|nr:phosphoserine transaminase [Bifidobacterium gallicum]EFA22699.1 putative phosphoserine transaminase [Bifidobacterium gallicum DSM 20093 = LMG 11596]KFI59650.1 phosphoserine aminotransferase [Bifidobacterium gallicum DSM 20093 = LMG 11596]